MRTTYLFGCMIISSLMCSNFAFAQNITSGMSPSDTIDYYSMSLEDLMKVEITVASTKALTSRESPGIVTLITSEEIASSGARDLIDVLRLVPGFEFGVDVQGVVGIGMRGNWGHEGKILILWDGLEMNERSFATTPLGHRFPLDQIDRIEIIRGPGSAMYGGYAELGVINIISKKGKTLQGGMVSTTYGQMRETLGRKEANIMLGAGKDDWSVDGKFTIGDGNRSDRTYKDVYGDSYDMKNNSGTKNLMANAGVKYKGLNVRLMYEDYSLQQRDLFVGIMPEAVDMSFKSFHSEIKYDFAVSNKLTITPRFRYKSQRPWFTTSATAAALDATDFPGVFSDKTVDQALGEITAQADVSEKVNLVGGIQYYTEKGKTVAGHEYDFTGGTGIQFYNFSAFGQGLFKLNLANVTLGACFNHHEQFGSSFVPRIGVTKVIDKFHGKLLFSQAFRAPGIQNIDSNPDIKPELTTVFEIETGYQLNKNLLLVANLYSISVDDPIVYFYNSDTDTEGYKNYDKTGTIGAEIELRYKGEIGSFTLNYSNYSANGMNKVASYAVPDDDNRLLALPQGKLNLYSNLRLAKKISFNPSFTYLSERSGYTDAGLTQFDPVLFVNTYFAFTDVIAKGLELGAGVYNLTDNDYSFIQPYASDHAPLPQTSREIVLKLKYKFKF
jgi:outer membrane receptor for ferrienterochelin and colicin